MHTHSEILAMIVPPDLAARIREKYPADGTGCIPEQDSMRIQKQLETEDYSAWICERVQDLLRYLKLPTPVWGPWPEELDDCIAIGTILAAWFSAEFDELLCELPAEALDRLEKECTEEGVSPEEWLANRIIERKAEH